MTFLRRFIRALHYARHPGGATHKSRLSKAEAEERKRAMTEQLRREVQRTRTVERQAYMAVAEELLR